MAQQYSIDNGENSITQPVWTEDGINNGNNTGGSDLINTGSNGMGSVSNTTYKIVFDFLNIYIIEPSNLVVNTSVFSESKLKFRIDYSNIYVLTGVSGRTEEPLKYYNEERESDFQPFYGGETYYENTEYCTFHLIVETWKRESSSAGTKIANYSQVYTVNPNEPGVISGEFNYFDSTIDSSQVFLKAYITSYISGASITSISTNSIEFTVSPEKNQDTDVIDCKLTGLYENTKVPNCIDNINENFLTITPNFYSITPKIPFHSVNYTIKILSQTTICGLSTTKLTDISEVDYTNELTVTTTQPNRTSIYLYNKNSSTQEKTTSISIKINSVQITPDEDSLDSLNNYLNLSTTNFTINSIILLGNSGQEPKPSELTLSPNKKTLRPTEQITWRISNSSNRVIKNVVISPQNNSDIETTVVKVNTYNFNGLIKNKRELEETSIKKVNITFTIKYENNETETIGPITFNLIPQIEDGKYMIIVKIKGNVQEEGDLDAENDACEFIINNIQR